MQESVSLGDKLTLSNNEASPVDNLIKIEAIVSRLASK